MNATIKLDKHMSKVIRWLQQSQIEKDDPRDVLKGIHVNENLAACDGQRLHVAKINDTNILGMIVKQALKDQGYDVIKKRMWKDGHLVNEFQQYIRTRSGLSKAGEFAIYNSRYAIENAGDAFNLDKEYTFMVVLGDD